MSGWMMMRSGRAFYPSRPTPGDIDIGDIAHALSMTCRYGGHCSRFYSVAEHSVLVAGFAPAGLRLAALLHDAAEAYIGDIPRPLKHGLGSWHAAERRIEEAVSLRFGTPPPMPHEIKALDDRIILDEWAALMPPTEADIGVRGAPLGADIRGLAPDAAKREFLAAFAAYGGRP